MVGNETVLVEDWFQQFPSHSIGHLMFGPDRALYASGGDGASFTFVDYGQEGSPRNPGGDPPVPVGGAQTPPTAEGGSLRSQDLRTPGDPVGLDGTIIRIDPDTAAGLPDNPLFSNSDANARRVVAYGLRNPFRFTMRPGTGEIWVGDVGWNSWEEINRVVDPQASVTNFGWPCYEGDGRQGGFDAAGLTICENLYNQAGAVTAPFWSYQHGSPIISGDSCTSGSSSITGLAFYQGTAYPSSYQGALFVADYSRGCIWVMTAGTNGVPDPATRRTFISSASSPVELQIGPGGDLFYVDLNGGTIRRIRYQSGNQPPVASIAVDRAGGPAPLTVNFDASGSSDPEARPLSYAWDLDNDGAFDDGSTAQAVFTYAAVGDHIAKLRVTDDQGLTDVAAITIPVGNSFPVGTDLHSDGCPDVEGRRRRLLQRHRQRSGGRRAAGGFDDLDADTSALSGELPFARGAGLRRRFERLLRCARPRLPVSYRIAVDCAGLGRARQQLQRPHQSSYGRLDVPVEPVRIADRRR